jgi:uncharacterized protein YndB with AHSA1/START domain
MSSSQFVYTTYIRTTPEKLWAALTQPEFTRQYWMNSHQVCDWKSGASWQAVAPDGTLMCTGEIIEIDPPRRLVFTWQHELSDDIKAEGHARVTYEIERQGTSVKLTVLNEINVPQSRLIKTVSGGWPLVLASLKSLLETGESLPETRQWGQCAH